MSKEESLNLKIEKVMKEITNFCEECSSHECCPEEECVLYRIEHIMNGENEK